MGTAEESERRIITELTQLLRKNADKLLSGETKLCLTTSSLATISANFRRVSDLSEDDERRELEGQGLITGSINGRLKKKVEDVKLWRDNVRTLQDFVVKTKGLKIIHGTYTIRAPVQIARFHSLQVLEVKKVPIHMVEGLSKLRGQLREIIITRSLQKLQDLFEICGGDRSSGLTWQSLKTANLGFNGLTKLDSSLKYVPYLEVFDLSHNCLRDTDDCLQHLTELVRINLGFNELTKVPTFSYSVGILKTLVLRNNNLDNIEGIEVLSALEELDLSHNLLADHQCLSGLSKLKKLMILCLIGNPLSYKWNHRSKTIGCLSPIVGYSIFLLDGQRLSAQETSFLKSSHHKSVTQRESNSYIIVDDLPSTGESDQTTDIVDSSRLSVKKKKGHKRRASKERNVIIADIMDGTDTEPDISEKPSPTGSYVENSEELERTESEKRKIEIMREHYKDDWLRALQADQGRLSEHTTEDQSKPREVTVEVEKIEERVTVTAESKAGEAKPGEDRKEREVEIDVKQQSGSKEPAVSPVTEDVEAIIQPEIAETVTSPILTKTNPVVDIYSNKQAEAPLLSQRSMESVLSPLSPDPPKGVEWGRSESQQEEYYGEESPPYIVMLPDQDMKQMFITVNERYITEKDMFGKRCEMLDLKCLQSLKKSEEVLTGRDIIGRVLLPVVTLEFDYVKKDMRQRKYAMEDDNMAQEFEELVGKHIKMKELRTQMKELVECLKCQHQFFKPSKSDNPAPVLQCPKCKSKMVIELNIRQFDHSSTKESLTNSLPSKEKLEAKRHSIHSQPSPTFQRKKGIRKLVETSVQIMENVSSDPVTGGYGSLPDDVVPQMRDKKPGGRERSFRNVTCYEEYDKFQDDLPSLRSSTGQPQMKHNSSFSDMTSTRTHSQIKHTSSWSDFRGSAPQSVPRGSVSSVESDIAILTTNSSRGSISAASEPNKEVFDAGNQIPGSREPVAGHVICEAGSDWIRDGQGNITPVGSPLTNSVCSSMVSSVYENTIAAETETAQNNDQDGITIIVREEYHLTGSAPGSGMAMQRDENQSEKIQNLNSNDQSSNIYSISNQSATIDAEVKVILSTEESTSIYDTADSSVSLSKSSERDSLSISINIPKENNSVLGIYDSTTTESEPRTSSPDNQNSSNQYLIRRWSKTRKSFKNKKRSGFYGAENLESSSELTNDSKKGSVCGDEFDSSTEITDSQLNDEDQIRSHQDFDFPDNISPIKRTSRNTPTKQQHRSAIILDGAENLMGEDSTSLDFSRSSTSRSVADISSVDQVCHSPPAIKLPWEQDNSEQRESTGGSKHENLNHDEFTNVDHRLQLYLELKMFSSAETCQCVLHCDIVQYMKPETIRSLLVISTNRLLLFEVIGELDSDSDSDWLKCYEDQPITELQYVDVGLGYQSLRLEFGTDCSSYTLLMMDEGRCKRFLTLLTDIMQNVSMNEHSKLEGISKSNPTTQENLESQVLNKGDDSQDLVKYLLVQLADNEDPEKRDVMGLVITYSDIILIMVNHQWPLPRLQAPLSPDEKGQQFTVISTEHINNIETLEFNEYNPKELRLSFFAEGSEEKVIWVIAMETTQGVKSLVDAIREPWENEFGVSFDVTPVSFTSFSEGEQNKSA